uniref:Uncharacterized protein n=1 Tax=Leersia perrieri TaxID=77586 RepID=A0A0D9VFB4_9ORYZ
PEQSKPDRYHNCRGPEGPSLHKSGPPDHHGPYLQARATLSGRDGEQLPGGNAAFPLRARHPPPRRLPNSREGGAGLLLLWRDTACLFPIRLYWHFKTGSWRS